MGAPGLRGYLDAVLGQASRTCGGANVSYCCPFHDDTTWSFAVNVHTGAAQCHSLRCGRRFNSLKQLLETFGIAQDSPLAKLEQAGLFKAIVKMPARLTALPESILAIFEPPTGHLDFPEVVLQHFEVYYDRMNKTLVYPLRDLENTLVQLHARALEHNGGGAKYFFYVDDHYRTLGVETCRTSGKGGLLLHGHHVLPGVLNYLVPAVILTEGPKQMMRVWEAGWHNVVATMGSVSEEQIFNLHCLGCDFFTFMDNNEAGWKATGALLRKLPRNVRRNIIQYPTEDPRQQPDDFSAGELRDILKQQGVPAWNEGMPSTLS